MTAKTAACWVLSAGLTTGAVARAQTPSDGEASFNVGLTNLREGRVEQALEAFKKAVKEDPKNPYFYKGLGQAYMGNRKFQEAVGAFHKALEINPYYVDVRNDLGTALILSGKVEEGKKELTTALNDPMNPSPEVTARNLGQVAFDQKNYAEAVNWFRTAVNRNKAYTDGYLRLADALVAMGNLEEATLQLEAAAKELPADIDITLAIGQVYYKAGRFTEARQRLELVAGKDPIGLAGRRAAALLKTFPH
jgi:superkiller protein 3